MKKEKMHDFYKNFASEKTSSNGFFTKTNIKKFIVNIQTFCPTATGADLTRTFTCFH